MILISDNHEDIVKDPKHIQIKELEDMGFLIKADGVVMGFSRSRSGAVSEIQEILAAIKKDETYQVCSHEE